VNQAKANEVLRHWDRKGRHVFTRKMLAKLFPEDSPKTFT
jgi:hypothetical protein